jgi:hypothetical protein
MPLGVIPRSRVAASISFPLARRIDMYAFTTDEIIGMHMHGPAGDLLPREEMGLIFQAAHNRGSNFTLFACWLLSDPDNGVIRLVREHIAHNATITVLDLFRASCTNRDNWLSACCKAGTASSYSASIGNDVERSAIATAHSLGLIMAYASDPRGNLVQAMRAAAETHASAAALAASQPAWDRSPAYRNAYQNAVRHQAQGLSQLLKNVARRQLD